MTHATSLANIANFFENFSPASIERLGEIYAHNACCKDPFNEADNLESIAAIDRHMFDQVNTPRFVIKTRILQDDQAFLVWEFLFRMKRGGPQQTICGGSHLQFDGAGKIVMHRDYWDAAEELYEKLPLLGCLMRFLKRKVRQ